ncbi:MAG: ATP-binding protein, partial [Saprospiraceae bacterium]
PQKLATVFISEFSVPNKNIKQPADNLTKIELAHNENFFNIAFSSQTYCQADKVRFTYQLQGMNQGWVTTSPRRNWTNYTDVQPGAYTFKVHRTGFPETLRSIDILIHPPWWLTWWAYAIYGLLALALLASIYKLLLSRQDAKREAQAHKVINNAKTKLYANITHEFRTPLTLILGISDQLQKLNLGVAVDNKIAGIKNNGNRILQLVNQILDLRKLQSGQLHLKPVQKEVTGLLKYAFQNFEPLAQNKNIRFVSEINFDSLIIDHDPDKLITIISNLLDNAIKFTPKDGQVVYRVTHQETTLNIEVEDTGIGIDEKVVSKVFDRYVSIDSPNYTSTGIGLSLTKALVELMGGTIQVKSTLGKGSIFKVVLPITKKAIVVEENTTRRLKDSPSISSNMPTLFTESFDMNSHKPIILVVEDNQDIAELVAAILGNSYQIGYASDGQAGMEKALEIIPDLIISDVMMPRMDGFEMCEALKIDQRTSHVPILLLTAKAGDKNKIAGLKRGADTYLTKPINESELLLSVKNALNSRQALRNFFSLSKKAPTKNRTVKNPISGIDFSIEDMVYQKVLAILDKESSNSDYSIDDLQQAVELSKSQLNRKLKGLVGLTTGNMIKYFRLEKARELLKTNHKTIAEVAFGVGFKDPSHFTRVFKETFEVTPSDFRETGVGI